MKPRFFLPKWAAAILFFLLFFSGMAGLVYEVVWFRIMDTAFGTTQLAISAVLAAYMVGMGLGSFFAGKYVQKLKHPLFIYALLEATIGVYALAVTPALYHTDFIYYFLGSNPSPAATTFFRMFTAFLLFLVPTAAMGATLPVVSRVLVSQAKAGKESGRLYAVNTFGAVLGCLSAGFLFIGWLGLDGTLYVASGANLLVAAISFGLHFKYLGSAHNPKGVSETEDDDFHKPPPKELSHLSDTQPLVKSDSQEARVPGAFSLSVFAALMASLLGGAASLSNEVVWTRVLGMVLDGTIYGFSALLAAFLTGIALGSAVLSPFLDKHPRKTWDYLIAIHLFAGVGAIVTMLTIPMIPGFAGHFIKGGIAPYHGFLIKSLFVFVSILLPTFFYGAAFPAAVKLVTKRVKASRGIARVYAANTVGSVIGVLAAGILLPEIGSTLQQIGLLAASLSFVTALAVSWVFFVRTKAASSPTSTRKNTGPKPPAKKSLQWYWHFGAPMVLLIGAVVLRPSFRIVHIMESRYAIEDYLGQLNYKMPEIYGKRSGKKVVYKAEGKQTIVTVRREGNGGYRLRNNGLNEAYHAASEPHYASVIFFLGTLPYMLHRNPKTALLIGLGTGGTAESLLRTDIKRLDIVELELEVVKASKFIYQSIEGDLSSHPLEDDRSRLIIDDARNTLLRWSKRKKPRAYDLIISQPSHPWLAGMSYLYTLEHFKLVRKNLAPDGIFCQWINLFRMNKRALQSVLASFSRVFREVHVFQTDSNSFLVLGSKKTFSIDPLIISHHLKEPRLSSQASLFAVDLDEVLLSYRLTRKDVKKLVGSARPNTDRHPIVEMGLPWVGHDTILSSEKLFKRAGLPAYLRPSVLKPTTSTPQLWSRLAKTLVEEAENGGPKKRKRARSFIKRWGGFLGMEKDLLLGVLDEQEGNEEAAIEKYRKLFKAGNLQATHKLGCLLQKRGRHNQAIPVLKVAINGAWEAESRICLSEALINQGSPERARNYLEPMTLPEAQRYPEKPQQKALLLLAEIERRTGHSERSLELVSRFLDLQPSSARGHYLKAELYTLFGQTEEARKHSRKAAALDQDRASRLETKGRRAAQNGHLSTAKHFFNLSTQADPRLDSPYRWMAKAYRDQGHYEALRRLRREAAARGVPSHVWRDDVDRTSTMAQLLGTAVAEEAYRVRILIDTSAYQKGRRKKHDKTGKDRLLRSSVGKSKKQNGS